MIIRTGAWSGTGGAQTFQRGKSMKQGLRAVAVVALLGLHPAIAAATVWNAVSDFSISSNPNEDWAYGYGIAGWTFFADSNASTFSQGPTDLWSRYPGDPNNLHIGNPMVAENMGAAYNYQTVVVPRFFGYTQVSPTIPWCSGQLQRREATRTLVNSSSWTYTQPASSERSSGDRSTGTQRNSTPGSCWVLARTNRQ
jgi:hypothetical protein